MAEKQTNYTIAETYDLPSGGKIYEKEINPHVELRSMTARDEMKRLNPSSTQFKTLADIIEGCMVEKPAIHVYDMALGDYEFLLHKLRIVTYGDEYKMALTCPLCGHRYETETHLEELHVKEFDLEKFKELQEFQLPKSGKRISIKFETPRMLDEIDSKTREMARKYKDADIAFDLLVLLETVIDTVDGKKLTSVELETFINKLPAMDMTKIVNNLDALNASIGLDNRLITTCPTCGGDVPTSFRFGPEFFRPTNI